MISTAESAPLSSKVAERGELTRAEILELADLTARELLGVSADEAFSMLERGELDGKAVEGPLRSLLWLLRD